MDFAGALTKAVNRIYVTAGVSAIYADRDGLQSALTVLVARDLSQIGNVANVNASTALVSIRASEMPGAPRRGETFTLADSTVLTVDSLQSSDGLEHKVVTA